MNQMEILTAILVVITGVYAYLTHRIVKEMQITREADLRPYLDVDAVAISFMFHLIIKNNGKTAAQQVRFKFDKSIENIWKEKVDQLPLFKDGIDFLAPGKQYSIALGPTHFWLGKDVDKAKHPSIFTVYVEYSYLGLKKFQEKSVINLETYMHTEAYENEVVKSIKKLDENIKRSLESLARSSEKISGAFEDITSPSGLDISQGTIYQVLGSLDEKFKEKIRFDLNLITFRELVVFIGIDVSVARKIDRLKRMHGYIKSFEDLKQIEGMTDEMFERLRSRAFIYDPYP
ncbi:MAG: helix-hairpin-helix domain-containing protein [Candidatus Manganitrophus sp. SA1]|nr:helix-hairpin-helix domain-containing protein [Candidatus Manganitrophus morganii]